MVSEYDWELLNKRLESIERSIEMLRALQPVKEFPLTQEPTDLTNWKRPYGALGEIPYVLSSGSLSDAGTDQVWNWNSYPKLADCISTTKLEE